MPSDDHNEDGVPENPEELLKAILASAEEALASQGQGSTNSKGVKRDVTGKRLRRDITPNEAATFRRRPKRQARQDDFFITWDRNCEPPPEGASIAACYAAAVPLSQRMLRHRLMPGATKDQFEDWVVTSQPWQFYARQDQLPPEGDWQIWLMQAGRGAGKTRAGAEWTFEQATGNPGWHVGVLSPTNDDLNRVTFDGPSGLMRLVDRFPQLVRKVARRPWQIEFRNGSRIQSFTGEAYERLRGPQHHCVARGSIIETGRGNIPIEDVRMGDLVRTRNGMRPVLQAFSTGVREVVRVDLGRRSVVCTPDHKLWTLEGWLRADQFTTATKVAVRSFRGGLTGGSRAAITSIDRPDDGFTLQFSEPITVKSPPGISSTTETRSPTTIAPATSKPSHGASTPDSTISGTDPTAGSGAPLPAPSAASPSAPRRAEAAIAACAAATEREIADLSPRSSPPPSSDRQPLAPTAGPASPPSGATPASAPEPAPSNIMRYVGVRAVSPCGEIETFDLTVHGEHEFFADGVLVSNCFWADELAGMPRVADSAFEQVMFGLRLGRNPRVLLTSTPRVIALFQRLNERHAQGDPVVAMTRASTMDNAANLSALAIKELRAAYEGTRLGEQELYGKLLLDVPGALWRDEFFQQASMPDHLDRIVVGVDPSGAADAKSKSDEIGIVVAALVKGRTKADDRYYVIEDATMIGSPQAWGTRVVTAFDQWEADRVVAEVNYGGAMVEATIKQADASVPVTLVTASRGKAIRAEPVSALYEQGRVYHVGRFATLESQMCHMTPSGYVGDGSPDHLDAAVWALTELMGGARAVRAEIGGPLRASPWLPNV